MFVPFLRSAVLPFEILSMRWNFDNHRRDTVYVCVSVRVVERIAIKK